MKTLFITGAEGFTGRHLMQFLSGKGFDVVGGVRNRARKLAFEKQNGRALVCDVSDAISVARAIASVKPDGVIHLAGTSQPSDALEEPLGAYQSIVTAWANVLDGVRRAVPRTRVLLVSSCEVYGNAGASGQPISEQTSGAPCTTFGSLKAAAESIAGTFFNNYHLNLSIVRPFHFIGSWMPETSFYANVARQVIGGATNLTLPDLDCKRDFLHIDDAVEACFRLLTDGKPNTAYNVCSGTCTTVRDVVQQIAAALGKPTTFTGGASTGAITALCGDNTRLRQTGWSPTRSLQQAVRDFAASLTTARPAGAGNPGVANTSGPQPTTLIPPTFAPA